MGRRARVADDAGQVDPASKGTFDLATGLGNTGGESGQRVEFARSQVQRLRAV
jgi:hypothetical protein